MIVSLGTNFRILFPVALIEQLYLCGLVPIACVGKTGYTMRREAGC
jgi:hypothetical protein